jgi:acyl-CoA synthetase (AMP-forming)/AMP-acid ligase II
VLAGCRSSRVLLASSRVRAASIRRATRIDTLFLGGAPLPPSLQRRARARVGRARVIELYGSTETMLLGTALRGGTLHPRDRLCVLRA